MLGTIVNTTTIITGSIIGSVFKKGIKDCKTMNVLPSLIIPILFCALMGLL